MIKENIMLPMSNRLFMAIGELNNSIIEKNVTQSRLDDELQKEEKKFSIIQTSIKKVSFSDKEKELASFSSKENALMFDLEQIKEKFNEINAKIRESENSIQKLSEKRNKLDEQINERNILIRTIKYFFGDKEREEIEQLRIEIDVNQRCKNDLLVKQSKLNEQKQQLKEKQANVREQLADIQSKIKRLKELMFSEAHKLAKATNELEDKKKSIIKSKLEEEKKFQKSWNDSLSGINELCQIVRKRQPKLSALKAEHINNGKRIPDSVALGRVRISFENWKGYTPLLVPFPFKKSFWTTDGYNTQSMVRQFILRMLQCLPVGSMEIIAADPIKLGASMEPFLSISKVKELFPEGRLLTRSDEIEQSLRSLTDYVEELLQNKFRGDTTNWFEYNAGNKDKSLKYKILLLFGVPAQLTERSLWFLGRILQQGPKCGVLPILIVDENSLSDRKFTELRASLDKFSRKMDAIIPEEISKKYLSELSFSEKDEEWPERAVLESFLSTIADKYAQSARFSLKIDDLWCLKDYFSSDTVNGLHAPIGWSREGESINFSIGGVNTEHHVLLAGRSGSGKSNLLHVLIHSLCHSYAPAELQIYLLDYKQGTEFSVYAHPPLPQAKLVATEGDPEYGVTVLNHLINVLEERANEFKRKSVRDFKEYREASACDLPRILLIIDEFQILFSENRQVAEVAEKLLNKLLRQGRAYGIHVLLATQTLRGIQSLSLGQLISQVGCRIALACNEEDSALILGNSNWEAATLKSPPEGIVNNSNGLKSANQRFVIPFADRSISKNHISNIIRRASLSGYNGETKIFNGSSLPKMPDKAWFIAQYNRDIQLNIGEQLCFDADPLSLVLEKRAINNLLISGYNDAIHDGLLGSIIQSLDRNNSVDEIIYYNGRSNVEESSLKCIQSTTSVKVSLAESVSEMNLAEVTKQFGTSKKVLIIDGLDSIREFHTAPMNFRTAPKESVPSAQENLKKILDEGPQVEIFVIAFVDNWKRCQSSCKDILGLFELRIGYCMSEEDAGALIHGVVGKFKGLESENRAVFCDRLKNRITLFRPYINI